MNIFKGKKKRQDVRAWKGELIKKEEVNSREKAVTGCGYDHSMFYIDIQLSKIK